MLLCLSLIEILGTKLLPGLLDLIAHLLDTLSKIVQSLLQTQADVSYIEQLLMSALKINICGLFDSLKMKLTLSYPGGAQFVTQCYMVGYSC